MAMGKEDMAVSVERLLALDIWIMVMGEDGGWMEVGDVERSKEWGNGLVAMGEGVG